MVVNVLLDILNHITCFGSEGKGGEEKGVNKIVTHT